jgi:hypothetical protein
MPASYAAKMLHVEMPLWWCDENPALAATDHDSGNEEPFMSGPTEFDGRDV